MHQLKAKNHIFLLALTLVLGSCNYKESSIPERSVYLERNLNTQALELRTIGGYKTYTVAEQYGDALGYGGLLVIYGFDQTYYAFDLACPNELKSSVRVVPDNSGQAVCSSCGSVFSIGYGSGNRLSGPAKEGLRKYQVSSYESVSGRIIQVTR